MINTVLRFVWERPWLLLLVALALGAYTGQKLYTMAQIRGWAPGAQVREVVVTDMATAPSRRAGTSYWIAWDGHDAGRVGPYRVNLQREAWEALAVGDTVELVTVPGSSKAYLRDGIYASIGNVAFDLLLFAAEIAFAVFALVRIVRGRGRRPEVATA